MPVYKLVYFNLRGRAEPVRWILAAAELPYEDVRYCRETEWPHKKAEIPYGKVPVLFVDGKPLSQSVAICRYLGKQHGLTTDDAWLSAVGDEVADAVHDLLPGAAQIMHAKAAKDFEKAKKLAAEYYSSTLPPVLRQLEKRLEETAWFCGDKMTWVDIFAACYLSQLSSQNADTLSSCPKLQNLISSVVSLSAIGKWIQQRPDTPL